MVSQVVNMGFASRPSENSRPPRKKKNLKNNIKSANNPKGE